MEALRKFEKLPPWEGPVLPEPAEQYPNRPHVGYRKVRRLANLMMSAPDTIVIHATAGYSSAGAMSVMQAGMASWHWLIPDENESAHGKHAWWCVPEASAAWHVLNSVRHPVDRKTMINDRSFGIEIVNAQGIDHRKDPFSAWQVDVTARLVNYIRSKYPIKYLMTHAYCDPRRKLDPGEWFPWDAFVQMIYDGARDAADGTAASPPGPLSFADGGSGEGEKADGGQAETVDGLSQPAPPMAEAIDGEQVWNIEEIADPTDIVARGMATTWSDHTTRTGIPADRPGIIACSLPRGLCDKTKGTPFVGIPDLALVRVYLPRTGKMIVCPVIDEGPAWEAQAGTGKPGSAMIDLTPATWGALGGTPNEEVVMRVLRGTDQAMAAAREGMYD